MSVQNLLLISRNDILAVAEGDDSKTLFRLLSWLTRRGYHLLATAAMPDHSNSRERWLKGGGDADLFGPDSIRSQIDEAGGTLDGVYYVPRSFFSQNKNRINALNDMMQRYNASPDTTYLFSSSKKWAETAQKLGIRATCLEKTRQLVEMLGELRNQLVAGK